MTIALIANPCAGGGKGARVIPRAEACLRQHGIDYRIFITQHHGHAEQIAGQLAAADYRGVVAMGGDGTNYQLLNGILGRAGSVDLPPVGIIPVGSGNSFARDLGISSTTDGLRALIRGRTRPVDVCSVTSGERARYFVNMTGVGFVARVARTAHRLKYFGDFSYVLGVFSRLARLKHYRMTLTLDGRRIEADNCFVEFCNSRYTGGKMLMAPAACIDDGWLDVVVVGPLSRTALLATFPKIFSGTHGDHPQVQCYRARQAVMETDLPQPLLPDGELEGATPIRVAIHPGKIRYFT